MTGEISRDVVDRIRMLALDWARNCGEEYPTIRIVSTSHREALAYGHDDENAVQTYLAGSELATAVYLVVLEGDFEFRPPNDSPIRGEWASLIFEQETLKFRGQTLRPEAYIPEMDLGRLGEVHRA